MGRWRRRAVAAVLGTGLIAAGAAGGEVEAAGADTASSPRGAVAGAGAAPVSETAVPTGAPARDTSPGQEPEAAKVLAELHVDVTGDDFPDTVDLMGRPLMAGSPMLGDFVLTMTHGVGGTKIILPLGPKNFVGLEPVLYPVDIPGQRGSGVLVSSAPGMGVDWVVKVHCRRGSTSLLAKGKGVHREVGSEGSWRQTHGPMNKNLIRGYAVRMSWQDTAKSKGCQRAAEYMRRARGEGQRSYPGRPAGYARGLATRIERFG